MKKLFYILMVFVVTICSCYDDNLGFDDQDNYDTDVDFANLLYDTTGSVAGYQYVDLGLSVKWAVKNLGASHPLYSGDYYAWGEVSTKNLYSWNTYIYYNKISNSVTKYNDNDEINTLSATDDAAVQNMGNGWRMPTAEEMAELRNNCTWKWYSTEKVNFYLVTGPNGNVMYIPAVGSIKDETFLGFGSMGCLWTSTLSDQKITQACELTFYCTGFWETCPDRFYGEPIRAVIDIE